MYELDPREKLGEFGEKFALASGARGFSLQAARANRVASAATRRWAIMGGPR